MNAGAVAVATILLVVVGGAAIGILAGSGRRMDLEQWTVGGRQFGVLLVWLLMAGEFYTTFTFLGASGWAYSRGAPVYYVLAYQPLSCVVGYFLAPRIWELGRDYRAQTLADFFAARFASERLGALVALVGIVFLIPYLELQLTGLGVIVEVASAHAVGRVPAMLSAFALVAVFVYTSGIRGVAWVSVLKDALLLAVVVTVGVAIPIRYFGGIGPMFATLARTAPRLLVLPGKTTNLGPTWFATTVLLTAFGAPVWPHLFAANLSAKSAETLRRNAIVMPLYGITIPLVIFVGFAATVVLPGLRDGDLSMLALVAKTFPAWVLGIVGGAGALTAMVPSAVLILSAATLFMKNVVRPLFAPALDDRGVARGARWAVFVVTAIALGFAIHGSSTLVALLLIGYAGVAQFLPGVLLGAFWPRTSKVGVACGLVLGLAIVGGLMLTGRDPYRGVNAGFLGLCANLACVFLVSVTTRRAAAAASVRAPAG